jgi:HAD superfamily hydrolase (TIGR01490 family)
MSERIAFFDFDGTITTKDTMLEFIRYYRGTLGFYTGLLVNAPFIFAYKTGLVKKIIAKQKFLGFYFKGETLEDFEAKCKSFSRDVLPSLIRPKALEEIRKLKAAGVKVVIVSASAENWIRYWALENNLDLMGTRLSVAEDKISGTFDGENCYGNEKVCRIKEQYDLSNYSEIFAYGDSAGDREMLALATHRFYKPFR